MTFHLLYIQYIYFILGNIYIWTTIRLSMSPILFMLTLYLKNALMQIIQIWQKIFTCTERGTGQILITGQGCCSPTSLPQPCMWYLMNSIRDKFGINIHLKWGMNSLYDLTSVSFLWTWYVRNDVGNFFKLGISVHLDQRMNWLLMPRGQRSRTLGPPYHPILVKGLSQEYHENISSTFARVSNLDQRINWSNFLVLGSVYGCSI